MKSISKSLKSLDSLNSFEILLCVLLLLYLISGVSTPYQLVPYVNNVFMYMSLLALVMIIYLQSNPVLAIFVAIVSIIFINRSKKSNLNILKNNEKNKTGKMNKLNNHLKEKTLEEEVVGQLVRNPDNIPSQDSYHPVLCDTHNATAL